jgi:hypothetical protein
MPNARVLCASCAILAILHPAIGRANFQMITATGTSQTAPPPSSAPAAASGTGSPQDSDGQPATPPPVHWKMAYGFGNVVPLNFACRQIVPPAVKITYGAGVDPQTPVSWKGGDTWNHVLRDAVAPTGLHLVMTHMAVEIVK